MDFDTDKTRTARALGAGNAGVQDVSVLGFADFTSGIFTSDATAKLKILVDTSAGDVACEVLPTSMLDANGSEVLKAGMVAQFIKASNEMPRNSMTFNDPLLGMSFVYGDREGETINAELLHTPASSESLLSGLAFRGGSVSFVAMRGTTITARVNDGVNIGSATYAVGAGDSLSDILAGLNANLVGATGNFNGAQMSASDARFSFHPHTQSDADHILGHADNVAMGWVTVTPYGSGLYTHTVIESTDWVWD